MQRAVLKYGFHYRQGWHLLGLALLIGIASVLADWSRLALVSLWGMSGVVWLIVSFALTSLHQFYVWIVWRLELFGGRVSPLFGGHGFLAYEVGFLILLAGRMLAIVAVGVVDAGSLMLPGWLRWGVAPVLLIPVLYGAFSVFAYFGIKRAAGADHFFEEYRTKPRETRGIFRYTSNGMYGVILPGLFLIGVWANSWAALLAAFVFNGGIWFHYYCTEKPDMAMIYEDFASTAPSSK